jgi:hypothetical protein
VRHRARRWARSRIDCRRTWSVTNPKHRAEAEHIWKIPKAPGPGQVGLPRVLQNRMLKDGKLNAYWVMVNNNMQAGANLMQEGPARATAIRRTSSSCRMRTRR